MKKVLSFILVLSMVLSSFGMAFAAPAKDEIAGHLNEDATLRLSDLGIVKGDDRGFALDANITRAEFAVLLVRALGLEGSANVAKGETQFTDVTVAAGYEWASGAINVATRLGYIQGYGNGKFGPADNIRYEDAITLIIRALGYEPAATAKGGYPVGYLVVAEQDVKNTKHVEGATGVAIKRGPVFQLLDNSLTKPKMIQVGYGSETKYVVSGQENTRKETILTTNLGFDEVEGTVVANYRVEKLKANEIKVNVEKENGVKVNRTTKYKISDKFDFDVDAVLGLKVSAWYNDDNEELFRYEVVTNADQVLLDTVAKDSATKDEVGLVVKDDEFDWNEDAVVYVNNEPVRKFEEVPNYAYGRFVLNGYNEVTFAYLFDFDTDKVGMAQEIKNNELNFVGVEVVGEDSIDLDDAEDVFVFNADFTKAELKDIEAGTAIFAWTDKDDNLFIVINDKVVEGKLEAVRVKDNRITVAGKNIARAAEGGIFSDDQGEDYFAWDDNNKIQDLVDEDVIVVLDLAGKALVLTTDANITSNTIYGIATYLQEGRTPVLTVFTTEGKEVEYKFEDRAEVNKFGASDVSTGAFDDTKFSAVSFKLNKDGEIKEKTLEVDSAALTLDKGSKDKFVKVSATEKYDLRTSTVFMKALNNGTAKKLKPSVIKYDDIIKRELTAETAYVIGEPNKDAKLIVFTDGAFEATDDTLFGLITGDVVRKGKDFKVNISVAGEGEKEYILTNENVKKGDIVSFTINHKGEATDITTLTKASDKDILKAKAVKVEDKDGDYLKLNNGWRLVNSDTVIYETNDKGNLDKVSRLNKITKDDSVIYELDKDGTVAVLVVVSKYTKATAGTGTPLEGTVTGKVYAIDGSTVTFEITKDAQGNTVNNELAKFELTENSALVKKDANTTVVEGIRQITLYLRNKIGVSFDVDVLKGGKIDIIIEK